MEILQHINQTNVTTRVSNDSAAGTYSVFFDQFVPLPAEIPETFPAKIYLPIIGEKHYEKKISEYLRKCCKIRDRFTFFIGNFFQNRKISYASSRISKFSCQIPQIRNFPVKSSAEPPQKKTIAPMASSGLSFRTGCSLEFEFSDVRRCNFGLKI